MLRHHYAYRKALKNGQTSSLCQVQEVRPCSHPAIVWRRGSRMESILGGVKMGASTKRKGDRPLSLSSWSSLSPRAWLHQVVRARTDLAHGAKSPQDTSRTYAQWKNPEYMVTPPPFALWDAHIRAYQEAKEALRGPRDDDLNEARVANFLALSSRQDELATEMPIELHEPASGSSYPLAAWLTTPQRLSTFLLDVEV